MPWARASGMVLEELPKVKGVGRANAAVLNHWFSLDWAEPSRSAMVPVRLGRWPPPKELLVLVATLIGSGLPDWKVVMPLMPQPEISLSTNPVAFLPSARPLPMGRS